MPCAIRSMTFMPSATCAEIGFGGADDRGAAALQAVHHAASAGVKTG